MNRISRRAVLGGVAASAAITKPKTALGSQASSAIRMGIIGTGGRGRYVGGIFAKDSRSRIVAICDIYPDRVDLAKTQIPTADQARVYKDYRELLAQTDIDAVLIATPVFLHPEHFEAAAKARKHIYCEKPAGADVAGVKRLMRAAEAADKTKSIAFGFQQRFSPEYLAAEKILRSGQLGQLTLMMSYWVWGGSAFREWKSPYPPEDQKIRHWGIFKETSGDFIVEQDCHGLDVLNWFAEGHPLKAIGDGGRKARTAGDISDHALVSYEYAGGLRGWLLGTQLPPSPYWDVKEQFFGTLGVLETERKYYQWWKAGETKPLRVDSGREITVDAVEKFLESVAAGKPYDMSKSSAEATLTSLLGRMAIELGRAVTWEEMMRSA
ncbi:MAG: Gfo/Idh/MocA family oxidoreductase [Acidobacteriota bacterium]